jgi:HD-GYP domain-containing protein (c-di-GMP phosphodiesterase class II)
LGKLAPWDAVLDEEPKPHRRLRGEDLDTALLVAADFIDLKSPFLAGYSRRCAQLAGDAAERLGYDKEAITQIRRAALVHEFGTTAVPNSIWDKPGPLTRAERDRVEIHATLTEQILRRSDALAVLNPVAACHHEQTDGSGHHKGLATGALEPGALLLAAADIYVALTSDRADRPAFSGREAAADLRRRAAKGQLDADITGAVLAAAGHEQPERARSPRTNPGGLTKREVEVLRLAARVFTIQQIADELCISPKTADHHIQHIYAKNEVSNRATAAMWAMQNGQVG